MPESHISAAAPSRRGFLSAVLAIAASLPAPTAAAATADDDEPLLETGRDWIRASTRFAEAEAAWEAAYSRCVHVPIPEALRVRPGDRNRLLLWEEHEIERDGARYYGPKALAELRRQEEEGIGWGAPCARNSKHEFTRSVFARATEVVAAGERFEHETQAALDACLLPQAGDELEAAGQETFDLAWSAVDTPARNATGFAVKLIMFERLWRSTESDARVPSVEDVVEADGVAVNLAVSLAIDLATLIERARKPGRDPDLDVFRALGALAAAIVRDLERRREDTARSAPRAPRAPALQAPAT